MKTRLRSRLGMCVLVLAVVALGIAVGGDVTVQNGYLTTDDDLTVSGDAYAVGVLYAGYVCALGNSMVDGTLYVDSYVNADYYLVVLSNVIFVR